MRHIRVDMQRALASFAAIAERTPVEQAHERMRKAKALFTAAAADLLYARVGAAERAQAALDELNAARAHLNALEAACEA